MILLANQRMTGREDLLSLHWFWFWLILGRPSWSIFLLVTTCSPYQISCQAFNSNCNFLSIFLIILQENSVNRNHTLHLQFKSCWKIIVKSVTFSCQRNAFIKSSYLNTGSSGMKCLVRCFMMSSASSKVAVTILREVCWAPEISYVEIKLREHRMAVLNIFSLIKKMINYKFVYMTIIWFWKTSWNVLKIS